MFAILPPTTSVESRPRALRDTTTIQTILLLKKKIRFCKKENPSFILFYPSSSDICPSRRADGSLTKGLVHSLLPLPFKGMDSNLSIASCVLSSASSVSQSRLRSIFILYFSLLCRSCKWSASLVVVSQTHLNPL